jgi:hypothetical protein
LPLEISNAFNLLAKKDGQWVRLKWKPKPYNVRMFEFDANTSENTVTARSEGDSFWFSTPDGLYRLKWIGQLKFPQAQRVAQALASEAGRIGLTESEWLRRNSK